jgi:hypothetical protein
MSKYLTISSPAHSSITSPIMKFLLAIFATAVAAAPVATSIDAIVGRDMQHVKREPIIDGNCEGLPPGACAGVTK